MSTQTVAPAATAIMPEAIRNSVVGQSAGERIGKRQKLLRTLELQGGIKPATILNLSPFDLQVHSGLINYTIPGAKEGQQFAHLTVTNVLTYPIYKGNTEMSDKRIKAEWDVKAILPIEQLMEFHRSYSADLGFEGVAQGGIVVFEGDASALKDKNAVVRVPRYHYEGQDRYLVYSEEPLADLILSADEQLRTRALTEIHVAQGYYDQGDAQRRNIGRTEHMWADFALRRKWINAAPVWRHTQIRVEDSCEKCGKQYVSKTGVCSCGYVRHPLIAFKNGEIGADHVRMDTLTTDEWKQVREIEARRKKARGE
ncbi:MAG TPA: hypothetical protein VFA71_15010 [Terriglobales bacterium]|nr:hypothetical protein [Terriglobales bacterium]